MGGSGPRAECFPFTRRFEIEIEPIFGTLALYDVREKKKVGTPPPCSLLPPPQVSPLSLLLLLLLLGGELWSSISQLAASHVPRFQKTSTLT